MYIQANNKIFSWNQTWWYTPAIPVLGEAKAGGSQVRDHVSSNNNKFNVFPNK
jgi:hypothetical protein